MARQGVYGQQRSGILKRRYITDIKETGTIDNGREQPEGKGKKPANVSLDELSINDSYQHIDYNEGFEVQLMSKSLDMAHKPAPHTVSSSLLRGMLSGEEAVTQQSFAVEPEFISTTQRHRHVVHTPASQQSSSMNGVHTSRKMPFRAEPQQ